MAPSRSKVIEKKPKLSAKGKLQVKQALQKKVVQKKISAKK